MKKVKERIVIPVEEKGGLEAETSEHFGRAPYFLLVELGEKGELLGVRSIPNESKHFGGNRNPVEMLLSLKPTSVIVRGIGTRALNILRSRGITVLRTSGGNAGESIREYIEGKLENMEEGCPGESAISDR